MAEEHTSTPLAGGSPATTAAGAGFPDELVALAPAGVGDDDAWERWAATDPADDREAQLDADLARPATRAVRLEEGLDRVARSLTRALPRSRAGRDGVRRGHRLVHAGDMG